MAKKIAKKAPAKGKAKAHGKPKAAAKPVKAKAAKKPTLIE